MNIKNYVSGASKPTRRHAGLLGLVAVVVRVFPGRAASASVLTATSPTSLQEAENWYV